MTNRAVAWIGLLLLPLAAAGAPIAPYNHDPASELGPAFWGKLDRSYATCGAVFDPAEPYSEVGKKQTPIDIVTANVTPAALAPLAFLYDTLGPVPPVEVETNDHAVEVPYPGASVLRIGTDAYSLLQFHFHAPSEHALNGQLFDAELHLVHRNAFGDLAVVGVFLTTALPANPVVDAIVEAAPLFEGRAELEGTLDAKALLPAQIGYYSYSGSLTTPPCTEGVRWLVLKTPVGVSPAAIAKLHEVVRNFASNNPPPVGLPPYENNNRALQKPNGRAVFETNR
jgi:carbonic anhydrase